MQFYVMTRTHVRQFTLVHVAKCHSTIACLFKITPLPHTKQHSASSSSLVVTNFEVTNLVAVDAPEVFRQNFIPEIYWIGWTIK